MLENGLGKLLAFSFDCCFPHVASLTSQIEKLSTERALGVTEPQIYKDTARKGFLVCVCVCFVAVIKENGRK